MKHFIIFITYTASLNIIDEILPRHREFLQKGYDNKMLLFSGPQNPRIGGIVAARANSLKELEDFFKEDPYKINNAAAYRFIEFNPVKFQEILSEWI
jgi:uncharacterized protein YciI